MAHTPPAVFEKPAPWLWKWLAGIVALLFIASFLIGGGEGKGVGIDAVIKNAFLGKEGYQFPMCADANIPIDPNAEVGVVEIKIYPECFGGIITPPPGMQGWRFNWQNPPEEGIWIWETEGAPVWVPPDKRDFKIKQPFRARGVGPLILTLYRVGNEPSERERIGPHGKGQPEWDPCFKPEPLDLPADPNGFGINLYPYPGGEPNCVELIPSRWLKYEAVVHTNGLEVRTPGDTEFRPLRRGENVVLDLSGDGKTLVRGTGQALFFQTTDPNNQDKDPNQ